MRGAAPASLVLSALLAAGLSSPLAWFAGLVRWLAVPALPPPPPAPRCPARHPFGRCEATAATRCVTRCAAVGGIEYATNDDSQLCCDRRSDKQFRESVNMHCPYSMLSELQLSAGDHLVVVEGYSNYAYKYAVAMKCDSQCA